MYFGCLQRIVELTSPETLKKDNLGENLIIEFQKNKFAKTIVPTIQQLLTTKTVSKLNTGVNKATTMTTNATMNPGSILNKAIIRKKNPKIKKKRPIMNKDTALAINAKIKKSNPATKNIHASTIKQNNPVMKNSHASTSNNPTIKKKKGSKKKMKTVVTKQNIGSTINADSKSIIQQPRKKLYQSRTILHQQPMLLSRIQQLRRMMHQQPMVLLSRIVQQSTRMMHQSRTILL
eukprot:TRINITY_DN1104_c0_g1_i2.p1 TRINITY_DN1104_c0_g1~~TRINITY_DN1104_c0_g1_i2.p1  ORF type:complete len:234 (+),score=43.51 TRINITY_DN1104_c0_g1_i2:236-937(+)